MHRALPLAIELTPFPDPWKTARRLAALPRMLFFDSAGGPKSLARYSYVTADPFAWLTSRGDAVLFDGRREPGNPFAILARELGARRGSALPDLPPFQGGAAGLFSYDLCHWLERLPRPFTDEFAIPDMAVGLYDWVAAWDHARDRAWLIGQPDRLAQIRKLLDNSTSAPEASIAVRRVAPSALIHFPLSDHAGVFSNFTRPGFETVVRRAIEYVHAGDCFQVNLSQRLLAPVKEPSLALYGRLRTVNPAPFAGYFDLGDVQILTASPERFLHLSADGCVETRPIKGTRPRAPSPGADAAIRRELERSAKDRAENIMIVDLLRNDLGRVCAYGSIQTPAICKLETYATVHHLVSEVCGRLRPDRNAVDLLQATFPGGSVTGAPKIRAMQIIAELEPTARGPYCGCLGWLGWDGAMDTNILIRTFTRAGGWLQFPVGGGIVADSDPAREYEETLHKAEGLLNSLTNCNESAGLEKPSPR